MYRHYRAIACVSKATAEELVKWCPQVASKTRVIANGIPLELFAMAKSAELDMIPRDVPKVVFVARFEPPKDHATLLRAFAKIKTRNAQLLLVGDGPLRPQLHQLACNLGIEARVTFLGLRSDVPRILKAADVYVHSTISDGFGIAACEAMAAGLPVIATDVPGLADVVGNAGALVPIGDDEALARELQSVLASPDRRLKMRLLGQERVKLFSIEQTTALHVDLYRSVLGQQHSKEMS
jgi:glycosyltransferase involved in cell wall biosynthesis